jgi:hypothetical protein
MWLVTNVTALSLAAFDARADVPGAIVQQGRLNR